MKHVVTSYPVPDMDGVGAMYAYSELLNKLGKDSVYHIEGEPKKEVQIVCELFDIKLESSNLINEDDKIILVDTNNPEEVESFINLKNVVEIIDHHAQYSKNMAFKDVVSQIEMIGAAATLVAERYKASGVKISDEVAILLYYGIISNTMNLKNNVTSDKDKNMVKWLENTCKKIDHKKIEEVFIKKSQISKRLEEEMEIGKTDSTMTILWTIGQLEVANVNDFLEINYSDIHKILKNIEEEKKIDYVSVNLVDILNGYSVIMAANQKTEQLITSILNVNFENAMATTESIVSRKEIMKKVKEKYSKTNIS